MSKWVSLKNSPFASVGKVKCKTPTDRPTDGDGRVDRAGGREDRPAGATCLSYRLFFAVPFQGADY